MKNYLRNIGTTASIATFVVVSLTGLVLFFGLKSAGAKFIHEWIGLAMILAVIIHTMANLTPFKSYFKGQKLIFVGIILFLNIFAFAWINSNAPTKSPLKAINSEISHKTPKQICDFFSKDCNKLEQFLNEKNINSNLSVTEISNSAKINQTQILELIFAKNKG
ncbi:MAG: DUF4405 domain-containing protein [Campylobacter sp.]|nr:DUF4405 domain-containing protein [Campylobacter sp.]